MFYHHYCIDSYRQLSLIITSYVTVQYYSVITSLPVLPSYDSVDSFSPSFATVFSDKIHKLHSGLLSDHARTSSHIHPPFTPPYFSSFTAVTIDEVFKLFSQSPDTAATRILFLLLFLNSAF
jgi:hypothetical protein